jgi:protein-disulfide isomerase
MCANVQGKFWEYHDELFANQKALMEADLKTYATKVGLDLAKWEACIKDGKMAALVDEDMAEGQKRATPNAAPPVRGTPTLFINGRKLNAPGGYTVDSMSAVIDKHILKKAPEPKAAAKPVEAAPK